MGSTAGERGSAMAPRFEHAAGVAAIAVAADGLAYSLQQ
jgi:hypothetical protein